MHPSKIHVIIGVSKITNDHSNNPEVFHSELETFTTTLIQSKKLKTKLFIMVRLLSQKFGDWSRYLWFTVYDLKVEILGCIPFDNIIEYDIDGDEYYNYPHLCCDFVNVLEPYEKFVYLCDDGYMLDEDSVEKD